MCLPAMACRREHQQMQVLFFLSAAVQAGDPAGGVDCAAIAGPVAGDSMARVAGLVIVPRAAEGQDQEKDREEEKQPHREAAALAEAKGHILAIDDLEDQRDDHDQEGKYAQGGIAENAG